MVLSKSYAGKKNASFLPCPGEPKERLSARENQGNFGFRVGKSDEGHVSML